MSIDIVEITIEEMEGLIARVESALNDGLSLEPDDIRLVLLVLRQFAYQQERINDNETLRQRFLKLMGLVSSSETQDKLFKPDTSSEADDQKKPKKNTPKPPRQKRKRNTAPPPTPKVIHHACTEWEKGQLCPGCEIGRLYKFDPATFIRIIGQAPLAAQKHILEQLRCNRCGALFTAPLPQEVTNDGARGQKYAYSARSVMSLYKFSAGSPYYRQEGLQSLLGVPVTASTIYDQCALLADDLRPIWLMMTIIAANAVHFHLDDTRHKILDQKTPIEKANRNGKGTRLRSGIYTSGVIATLDSGEDIVLFKTNIGHAGEWIDEILSHRDPALALPLIMCDALSSNRPTVPHELSLCNVHSRRCFTDVAANFPQEVESLVKQYARIWQNETEVKRQQLDAKQRLAYHQEHSLPVMEDIKVWAEQQRKNPQWQEHSGLARAVAYLLKYYPHLTAFCRIAGAQIDNNHMEMVLRLIVLGRKNFYFYRTQAGAEVGDIFTSMIATCELNGVNPFEYFNAVQQHRFTASRQPGQWLPTNYRVALERATSVAA